jgi:hypothetical protein
MGRSVTAALGVVFLLGCGLAGCADDDTPMGTTFTYNGNTWRVADVREEGRLTITAVDPRLAGLGTEAAARHQVATMPEAEYRAAATGWLTVSGRFCTPGPAEDLGGDSLDGDTDSTGYQYHYSCWVPA